jgi:TolA-binding protein
MRVHDVGRTAMSMVIFPAEFLPYTLTEELHMRTFRFSLISCLLLAATLCVAQSALLDLPRQSQRAVVVQRIGITDITINYHRPLANGRKIWGGLVPYGQVWRAGANENTTITFSDPVSIEGKPLAAGTYGLHMIPNENEWTVIFSKVHSAWGSFTYDQKEDALRVTVKPVTVAESRDALAYDFDQLKPDSAVATMTWEKVAVPFSVSVSVPEVVDASLQKQLRGLQQYTWEAWDEAATYLVDNKTDLKQALADANQSIQVEQRYDNLMTKSRILDAMGQTQEATTDRDKALGMANAGQLYQYARGLQRAKEQEKAMAIFRTLTQKYPDDWITHAARGRIYTSEGNYDKALTEMRACLTVAPDNAKPSVETLIKRLEAKQDINQ